MEAGQCLLEGCHSGPTQRLEGFVQNGCILPLKQTKVGNLGQGGARVWVLGEGATILAKPPPDVQDI